MRVLIWDNIGESFVGGNRLQRVMTAAKLRELGVEVTEAEGTEVDFRGQDLVHAFALGINELRSCRRYGIPIALSTIFHPYGGWPAAASVGERWTRLKRKYRAAARAFVETAKGRNTAYCTAQLRSRQRARVRFEMADLLLPNSQSEAETIVEQLGVTTPYHIVPKAADPTQFYFEGERDRPERKYVTCVGRIEKLKNQLGLIEALRDSDYAVRIVGPEAAGSDGQYMRWCRDRATENIEFTGPKTGEDLVEEYRRTKVHVLPSDSETTGLVSLEAALCGANVVTTDRGYARDYFEDQAWYCQANSPKSIRAAVEAAWASPYREALRRKILGQYTWEHAAAATRAGYEKLLGERGARGHEQGAPRGPVMVGSNFDDA